MNAKKCPVCGWEIKEAFKVQADGKEIAVCCQDCAKTVKESPAKYSGDMK